MVILFLALFRDRSRGRRRCPKCWYDMSRVPGLKCPECGKAAKSENWLHVARRRWRCAVCGAALAVGLPGALVIRTAARDGWWTVTPASILVFFFTPHGMTPSKAGGVRYTPMYETCYRAGHGGLWGWQYQAVFDRSPEALVWLDPAKLALGRIAIVTSSRQWFRGDRTRTAVFTPRWPGASTVTAMIAARDSDEAVAEWWNDQLGAVDIGAAAATGVPLEFDVEVVQWNGDDGASPGAGRSHIWSGRVRIPTTPP
jgi:hypothetical protein